MTINNVVYEKRAARFIVWMKEADEKLGRVISDGRQHVDGYSALEAYEAWRMDLSAAAYVISVKNGPLWTGD